MEGQMNIDSIIFDLDGTLWDATIACSMAWNKSFEQCGFQPLPAKAGRLMVAA
jgi:beta-phosphoglucomutase-like phosphatase (HAD superfamily)